MQPTDFHNLQFGNVITDEGNRRQYIVQHIVRDCAGQVTHIGVVRAFSLAESPSLRIDSKVSSVTYLSGKSVQPE